MNWGHKLTIAIVAFMSFILYMVVQASMKSVDLEAADYYQQGVSYQNLMEAMKNASDMEADFKVYTDAGSLVVDYPQQLVSTEISGKLNFFKPDNSKLDKEIELQVGSGKQLVPLDELAKGVYILKINWTANDKEYYVEKALNLN